MTSVAAAGPPPASANAVGRAFEVTFAPSAAQVGRMRRITRASLRNWALPGALIEDAELVVSELVTNAIDHGHGCVGLRVRHVAEGLRVEVSDDSTSPAELRQVSADEVSGRGLFLVDTLTTAWGVSEGGRTTWCLLPLPPETT